MPRVTRSQTPLTGLFVSGRSLVGCIAFALLFLAQTLAYGCKLLGFPRQDPDPAEKYVNRRCGQRVRLFRYSLEELDQSVVPLFRPFEDSLPRTHACGASLGERHLSKCPRYLECPAYASTLCIDLEAL